MMRSSITAILIAIAAPVAVASVTACDRSAEPDDEIAEPASSETDEEDESSTEIQAPKEDVYEDGEPELTDQIDDDDDEVHKDGAAEDRDQESSHTLGDELREAEESRTEGAGDAGPMKGLGDESDGPSSTVGTGEARKTGPELKLEDPDVEGSCDATHIEEIVDARSDAILHCYERQLYSDPELSGELTLEWTIAVDGSVAEVEVSDSTLEDSDIDGCLVRTGQRMRFDEPDEETCDVAYLMSFIAPK